MSTPEFYDNFITYQIESGVNDRIYDCYKRMKQLGINSNTSVLEIGCGTGQLSNYFAINTNNKIVALDPTIESLNLAKNFSNKK